ncbi:hypothetical protein A6J66_017770 [Yersinia enterocolitica]|nr:hypothetical protein A6J66_017770 [Yersinia enterocolitica]
MSAPNIKRVGRSLPSIPFVFEATGLLATFVTRPILGPRLCEAAASSVQICSRQICHPNHLLVLTLKISKLIEMSSLAAYL